MLALLIALQVVQVAILCLHDWLPIGRLTDIGAIRANDTRGRLVLVTSIQTVPFIVGLAATARYAQTGRPHWVWTWLWISHAILFAGELRAWWWPYLVRAEPVRAARYRALFGRTHAFLPVRNGMVPNTLHTILHAATAATLVVLAVRAPGY